MEWSQISAMAQSAATVACSFFRLPVRRSRFAGGLLPGRLLFGRWRIGNRRSRDLRQRIGKLIAREKLSGERLRIRGDGGWGTFRNHASAVFTAFGSEVNHPVRVTNDVQ